jgi:monofunctional biosynthetic peptidoglycan transglycosylase
MCDEQTDRRPEDAESPPAADEASSSETHPETEAASGAHIRQEWLRAVAWAGGATGAAILVWLAWTWITWPDVGALRADNPATTAFIEMYRESQREQGRGEAVDWTWVPYDEISSNLKRVVVASEDTEFFFHDGFSEHELREALKKAVREREAPRGASTITQQLAKNLWLSPRRTLTRKLREGILTRQLESELSKERILELYLNLVELGPGVYGAEAAARRYFGIAATDLSLRQAAMLAAALPRPKRWNPTSDSEYYARRVDRILEIERQLEYLDRYIGTPAPASVHVDPPAIEDPSEMESP